MIDPDPADPTLAALRRRRLDRGRRRRRVRRVGAIAVLALCAVLCGTSILIGQLKARGDVAAAERLGREYSAPPLATPSAAGPQRLIAVVGDEWAAPRNSVRNRPWSLLLQQSVGIRVRTFASSGGAYVADSVGSGGAPFSSGASSVPSTASLVVFFGGARDGTDSKVDLAAAATQAFADAAARAPGARIVVVGPVPERPDRTAELKGVRAVLKTAAAAARATWIDPVEEDWFDRSGYWSASAASPSSAGNERLANRMQSALAPLLDATATPAPTAQ